MGFSEWLDQGDRGNIFWAVIALLCAPFVLAFMSAAIFGLVLVGAWLGLWHMEPDH